MSLINLIRRSVRKKPKRKRTDDFDDDLGNGENFNRSNSIRHSLTNYGGLQHTVWTLTAENRKLRQKTEFATRRLEYIETQAMDASEEGPAGVCAADPRIIEEKLAIESQNEVLKTRCELLEQQLLQETRGRTQLEQTVGTTFNRLSAKHEVDSATLKTLDEVKTILMSTKDEFLQQLQNIDARTRAIMCQMENMVFLPDAIRGHHTSAYVNVPENVKCAVRDLQTIVGVNWPRFARELGLSPEYVQDLQDKEGNREFMYRIDEMFWTVVSAWYKNSSDVTIQALDTACRNIGLNIFHVSPMPPHHREAIEAVYPELVDTIVEAVMVITEMRQSACLSPATVAYVINHATRSERIKRLVDILPTMGHRAFGIFQNALNKSGHEHLARRLLEEEARILGASVTSTPNVDETMYVKTPLPTYDANTNTLQDGNSTLRKIPLEDITNSIRKKPLEGSVCVHLHDDELGVLVDTKASVKHMEAMLMEMSGGRYGRVS